MAFTTQVFLFAFFPLSLAACLLTQLLQRNTPLARLLERFRFADLALVGVGCVFYMWSCFDDLARLLAYVGVVWLLGRGIEKLRDSGLSLKLEGKEPCSLPVASLLMTAGAVFLTWVLVHFKYTGMVAQVWNFFFKDDLTGNGAAALLGISFITFSAVSYLADIRRGKADGGSLLDCALYLTFFPKVVSGPIVLWRDFRGAAHHPGGCFRGRAADHDGLRQEADSGGHLRRLRGVGLRCGGCAHGLGRGTAVHASDLL